MTAHLICGARNTEALERLGQPGWLATDLLRMCLLPRGHEGDHHWRIPSGWSMAHPSADTFRAKSAIARRVGHLGADAVNAAWAAENV